MDDLQACPGPLRIAEQKWCRTQRAWHLVINSSMAGMWLRNPGWACERNVVGLSLGNRLFHLEDSVSSSGSRTVLTNFSQLSLYGEKQLHALVFFVMRE